MRLGKPNRSKEALLSFDRMREYLLYPPVTGLWVWNERPHKRQGTPAGSVATDEDGKAEILLPSANTELTIAGNEIDAGRLPGGDTSEDYSVDIRDF